MEQVFKSTWELNVFLALQELKIEGVQPQVPFFGGYTPGGTVVDFVIYKPGALHPIALYVDGPYWHNPKKEPYEMQKRKRLEKMGYKVLVIKEEAEDLESAKKWLRQNL